MGYDYQTSLPAYNEVKKNIDYCRSQVFLTIKKIGICNDKQVAEKLGWSINRVTPRRGELVNNGLVELAYKKKDPSTNRTVNYWREKKIVYLKQSDLFS